VETIKPIIAVVDDEVSVRTMLGRVLRIAGYRVFAFSRGEDFMASLATRPPACAIVDIHMPEMNGFEVQSSLLDANVRIPTILITASDDAALDDAARQLRVRHVLRKPFSAAQLLDAVNAELKG
jgi:FixJ family two-component response regulator